MKNKKKNKNYDITLEKINFVLFLLFMILNDLDYFSTYLSIISWWIEINPVILIMLDYPFLFFIVKIFFIPIALYYLIIKNINKFTTWSLIIINTIYLFTVIWNFKIVFN